MKILLDECIPRKFKRTLAEHSCQTVPEAGLAGKRNGDLLDLAERPGCQVFVTIAQGIEFEQNLTGRKLGIVILVCKSNRLEDLLPLAPACAIATSNALPGRITRVSY
jgi:predicted nuclease of predicted toxin-antitoxin system